jgi:hypothetical protein
VITSRRAFLATLAGGIFVPKFEKWFRQGSGLLVPRQGIPVTYIETETVGPYFVEIIAGPNAGRWIPARYDADRNSIEAELPAPLMAGDAVRLVTRFTSEEGPPLFQPRSLLAG